MHFALFVIAGITIGTIGTIIGAGGGFILMPLLLILYPKENPDALTSISLAIVFLNALSGTIAYSRMKRIDYKSGIIFSLAAIPGSILGAVTTGFLARNIFNIVFSILMIVGAVYLFLNTKKAIAIDNIEVDDNNHKLKIFGKIYFFSYNPKTGVIISLFTGYVSSLLGVGGGFIHVPILVSILDFTVHTATATSHFVLALTALTGTIVHIIKGDLFQSPVSWNIFPLSIGVLAGAQIGAYLSGKIKGNWIIKGLAIVLVFVGIRIILTVF